MNTFEFTLKDPIDYQHKGENDTGNYLTLTAPSAKNRKHVCKLDQGFMRSAMAITDDAAEKPKEEDADRTLKPEEVLALLQMSSVIEFDEYVDRFVKLLCDGVCKVEGKADLTKELLEKISYKDLVKLLGEYLVNFILGSLE